jgi:UDP-glucuronate decarboxylase
MLNLDIGLLQSDISEILEQTEAECLRLKNEKIVILGGTGFIGKWLTSFLCAANDELNLNLSIIIPTRNQTKAKKILPFSNSKIVNFYEQDFSVSENILYGECKYYILGATPTTSKTGSGNFDHVYLSTINSIKSLISYPENFRLKPNVVNLSSGAVYSDNTSEIILEKHIKVKKFNNIYAKSKFDAEKLLIEFEARGILNLSSPRLFAFYGPYLKLDEHFAIGNFLKSCLESKPIEVKGNPKTTRSYLYPTDLVIWIIKLLLKPNSKPLNFGSDKRIFMEDLALLLSKRFNNQKVNFSNPEAKITNYVPSIENTKKFLNVSQRVSLEDGIDRWVKWIQLTGN